MSGDLWLTPQLLTATCAVIVAFALLIGLILWRDCPGLPKAAAWLVA